MTLGKFTTLLPGWLLLANLQAAPPGRPTATFMVACAPCHGPDGKAKTPASRKLRVKDLSISKLSEAEIRKQILNGSKGPADQNKMPSFEGKLSEEELKEIVQFVKALQK